MKKRTFISPILAGKLDHSIAKAIGECLKLWEGKKIKLTVEEYKRQRSLEQNKYHFGIVVPAFQEWFMQHGESVGADSMHEWIKRKVWKYTRIYIDPTGDECEEVLSSTKLKTDEWSRYLDITIEWAARHGFQIPYPQEKIPEPPAYLSE